MIVWFFTPERPQYLSWLIFFFSDVFFQKSSNLHDASAVVSITFHLPPCISIRMLFTGCSSLNSVVGYLNTSRCLWRHCVDMRNAVELISIQLIVKLTMVDRILEFEQMFFMMNESSWHSRLRVFHKNWICPLFGLDVVFLSQSARGLPIKPVKKY